MRIEQITGELPKRKRKSQVFVNGPNDEQHTSGGNVETKWMTSDEHIALLLKQNAELRKANKSLERQVDELNGWYAKR